ncbi:MAG TPA: 50S ribosomal protein L21 [Flavisolibacter sp.]|jgi:large subunit ribosomal protein L21|nr:50S ribosomal protein L21 [Flavisolibacter sp.]
MFAIVKIAGKQFKVEKDQTLYVPNIGGNTGDKVEFGDVILADNNGNLSFAGGVNVKVSAEIIDHVKGDKVIAYKQKRRKGFRKKLGHRTHYTKIKISDIA